MAKSGDNFDGYNWRAHGTGIWGVEARVVAKHPTMQRIVPVMKDFPASNTIVLRFRNLNSTGRHYGLTQHERSKEETVKEGE